MIQNKNFFKENKIFCHYEYYEIERMLFFFAKILKRKYNANFCYIMNAGRKKFTNFMWALSIVIAIIVILWD